MLITNILFALLSGLLATTLAATNLNPALNPMNEGTDKEWQLIQTQGETRCAGGSRYAYYLRQVAESNKLLIFLQGGGGCPEGVPCDPDNPKLFDPSVYIPDDKSTHSDSFWDNDNPEKMDGVFNLYDSRNPFLDYNMVFVPYCTADVHLGSRKNDGIYHYGFLNTTTALEQSLKLLPEPEQLVVSGSSAGAIATPFYAGLLAEKFPQATLTVLGDSAGGYARTSLLTQSLKNWGADKTLSQAIGYEDTPVEDLDFETAWLIASEHYPKTIFARFNTLHDKAQQQFLEILGSSETVEMHVKNNLSVLETTRRNCHHYVVDDDYHTILFRPRFYTERTSEEFFYQWVDKLISHQTANDHQGLTSR